jgi:hypothetical protein
MFDCTCDVNCNFFCYFCVIICNLSGKESNTLKIQIRNIFLSAITLCAAATGIVDAKDTPDRVFWTKHNILNFRDFKGNPFEDEEYTGILDYVLAKISKSIVVQSKSYGSVIKFKVYAAMYREYSWIKNPLDSASLRHEQGHFDICEIYARMLRKEMIYAQSKDHAKRMFDKISGQEQEEQQRYDKDNSGTKEGITKKWRESINKRLHELEAYRDPIVYFVDKQ